jgi:hypothetical protein
MAPILTRPERDMFDAMMPKVAALRAPWTM